MKTSELIEKLNLNVFSGKSALDREISGAYVSDLLSDVMGSSKAGNLWLTLQTHKNIMAVASLRDLSAIILVKGMIPDEDTKQQSENEGIPLLGTNENTFELAGTIYELLKREK